MKTGWGVSPGVHDRRREDKRNDADSACREHVVYFCVSKHWTQGRVDSYFPEVPNQIEFS